MKTSVDLDDLIVSGRDPLLKVMEVIDRSGLEVALVCDARRKLQAVVTDGDIRRWLIKGGALDDAVAKVGNPKFTSVPPSTPRHDALHIMVERAIKCVPVVDGTGTLVDIHTLHVALLGHRTESWAVVMAGGKGERLGELTRMIPKPMLPVGDRPILERIVQSLVAHGIRRIFLSVNYLGTMIEDHFGDGSRHFCRIDYLREDKPLGTGGPISLLPSPPTAPLLVMNGDLLTSINFSRLFAFHRAGEFAATVALREHIVKVPFGVAELDGPKVRKLVEKPTLNYRINAGIYVLSPETVARVPKGRMYPITELLDGCMKDGQSVGAYHMEETWNDIGLPEEYQRAQNG
jgi:dTDP-glucose pyrophosphorylase